jgi:hypothetical protein
MRNGRLTPAKKSAGCGSETARSRRRGNTSHMTLLICLPHLPSLPDVLQPATASATSTGCTMVESTHHTTGTTITCVLPQVLGSHGKGGGEERAEKARIQQEEA